MTGGTLYSYNLSGRRAGTVFALSLTLMMLTVGVTYGAAWYFLAPLGIAAVLALWAIIANPQTGSSLNAEELRFWNRSNAEAVRIADVASMTVRRWTDGPDTVALTLKSGNVVHIPGMCADSKLAVALRDMGILEASPR